MAGTIYNGDCLAVLKELDDNSVDSLVTGPPAGISFMGKEWDDDKGGRIAWIKWMSEVMRECLRVLKPGAHGLVWALPRTSHWTATALEDAGFEVRDVVTHLFGTGFPKSLNIGLAIGKAAGTPNRGRATLNVKDQMSEREDRDYSVKGVAYEPATDAAKQWAGWGTALKPASEHWILVRKPCSEKTVAKNVLKYGTGGINIDASRIGTEVRHNGPASTNEVQTMGRPGQAGSGWQDGYEGNTVTGRFPANLVLDEEAAALLDEQSGVLHPAGTPAIRKTADGLFGLGRDNKKNVHYSGSGGASRFFYCAKASSSEKGEGNTHPTVKALKLMQYLIKLVTPVGGTVLDPFMGSGSTGVATKLDGFDFIGIEQSPEYFEIARARLKGAA